MERINSDNPCIVVVELDDKLKWQTQVSFADHPHTHIGTIPGVITPRQNRVRVDGVRYVITQHLLNEGGTLRPL